jgi:hypothetical protein
MTIRYDQDTDTLTISLGPRPFEAYPHETGDFTAYIDDTDALVEIIIARASRFVARALAAGIKVEGAPEAGERPKGMVWYDADSSMISAFGYDESEEILELAFHRTGVYRYYNVPLHVFKGLRDASSKGSYIRGHIIDMYPYEKKRGRSRR